MLDFLSKKTNRGIQGATIKIEIIINLKYTYYTYFVTLLRQSTRIRTIDR
jgi:hypothetical protein